MGFLKSVDAAAQQQKRAEIKVQLEVKKRELAARAADTVAAKKGIVFRIRINNALYSKINDIYLCMSPINIY